MRAPTTLGIWSAVSNLSVLAPPPGQQSVRFWTLGRTCRLPVTITVHSALSRHVSTLPFEAGRGERAQVSAFPGEASPYRLSKEGGRACLRRRKVANLPPA